MSELIARDFIFDTSPQPSAFGLLTKWRVDDLAGDGDAEGLASDEGTARLAAVTHIASARLKP